MTYDGTNDEAGDEADRPSQVRVMLRINGTDLDPDEVSQCLGLRPTKSFRRGDSFRAGGRMLRRAYGSWSLSTEGTACSDDLSEHSSRLLEWLAPAKAGLETYLEQNNIGVAIAFWWAPSHGPVGFTLTAPIFRQLGEMCKEFEFFFA